MRIKLRRIKLPVTAFCASLCLVQVGWPGTAQAEKAWAQFKNNQMEQAEVVMASVKDVNKSNSKQNQVIVRGKITAQEDGVGLPGVTVMLRGNTSVGTTTDIDGNFLLSVPDGSGTLIVSYVGYASQEIPINNRSQINISLATNAKALQEVVVVGYGEQTRATLTGAVEQLDARVFEDRAVTNPVLALQGQTPGLVVTRNSSRPGREGLNLQIRGVTSVNGGDPLVVIDGVPAINAESFYSMNPDDIKTVTVLKDGAGSIYGARAANGVILVTTKRGASGEIKVNYTGNTRLNTIGIRPPTPTMQDYATVWLEGTDQDMAHAGTANYWGWQNRANLERMHRGEEGIYPTQFWGEIYLGNAPRFDEMYGNSISNQHNLSVSGGSEKSSFRLSLGYAENVGNLQTTYDGKGQYNLRLNHDYQISDRLKLETGLSYFRTNISSPSGGLGVVAISNDPPFFPAQNPYGQWYANFGIAGNRNAVAETVAGGRDEIGIDQLKLMMGLTYDITNDLSFKVTAAIDKEFKDQEFYHINVPHYTWFGELAPESVNPISRFEKLKFNLNYENYGGFLNYKKTLLEDHNISVMGGMTAELTRTESLRGARQGFIDNGLYDLNVASPEVMSNSGGSDNWGFVSYVGRFNYNYKNKYLLELSGRRDGTSKFATGYKWINFGNASIGWVLTEEAFLRDVPVLDFLKLRASYGEMGGQSGIGNYDHFSTVELSTAVFGQTANRQTSAFMGPLTSFTRTWERIGMANYGVEFRLLDHRLSGSFDYFTKKNDGMLIRVNYPSTLGGSAPQTNSGVLDVKGWEAMLGWNSNIGDFRYNISVNMSDTRNNLTSMEGVSSYNAGLNRTVQGYPLNSYFLYQTDGFFANSEEVQAYYDALKTGGELSDRNNQATNLRPGDTRKIDLDGDGLFRGSGTTEGSGGDVKFMGDNAPHYTYGLNLGFQFKGFDLTTFFQGVINQHVVRTDFLAYPFVTVYSNQPTGYIGKTWTEENPDAEYPRMSANNIRAGWNWRNNDFMLLNNRYIRMKTLVAGYTFQDINVGTYKVDKVRLYFSGNDLFEFTSIKDGFDPEYGSSTNSSYPFNRIYSLGLNVTF